MVAAALELLKDEARHTVSASAVDAAGLNCAAATNKAVAWSALGALNRVAVLSNVPVREWVDVMTAARDAGLRHDTPYPEAIATLRSLDARR